MFDQYRQISTKFQRIYIYNYKCSINNDKFGPIFNEFIYTTTKARTLSTNFDQISTNIYIYIYIYIYIMEVPIHKF